MAPARPRPARRCRACRARAARSLAQLGLQRVEPLDPPAGADHPPAVRREAPRRRRADAGGRAGDEDRLGHRFLLPARRRADRVSRARPRPNRRSGHGRAAPAARASPCCGSATMCSRQTSGACFSHRFVMDGEVVDEDGGRRLQLVEQLADRPALAALVAQHPMADVEGGELLDPVGLKFVADIGEDDDLGLLGDRGQRRDRAGRRHSAGASRASKNRSSSAQIRSSGTGAPRLAGQRPGEARRVELSRRSVRLVDPLGEMRHEVEDHLVAIADEQRPAHASSRRRASGRSARRDADRCPRRRSGRARAPPESAAPRPACRGSSSRARRSSGVRPVRARKRSRAGVVAQRPAERVERQRRVICRIVRHLLGMAPWRRKSWLSRTTNSI